MCLIFAGLLTACTSVRGTPLPAEIDVRELQIGKYTVDPHHDNQPAGKKDELLEGMRMAEAPSIEVDASLTHGRGISILETPEDAADSGLADVGEQALDRRDFVVGVSASGADRPDDPARPDRTAAPFPARMPRPSGHRAPAPRVVSAVCRDRAE